MITLITSKTCSKCPEAKQYMKDNKIECEILSFPDDEKAITLVQQNNIHSVPTIIDGEKVYTFYEYKQKLNI
ncbi:MAG: glutaredoxin family protein [bacterium]